MVTKYPVVIVLVAGGRQFMIGKQNWGTRTARTRMLSLKNSHARAVREAGILYATCEPSQTYYSRTSRLATPSAIIMTFLFYLDIKYGISEL